MCAHGKGDTPFPPFPDPTTHSHLSVDVHLPPQVAQRADQRLRLAVDAHPHPVDKDLGRVGDDAVQVRRWVQGLGESRRGAFIEGRLMETSHGCSLAVC